MQIRLKDYLKAEERGASCAVARALSDMQAGDTLLLGGQRIDFYKEGAAEKYYCVSNNDKGQKNIVFPLMGKKNITVDGEGAELIFHGEIMPFVLDACENIIIKNLSIDYASPMYVQAEIAEAQKGYMELTFDGDEFKFREEDGKFWIYSDEDAWKQEFRHCLVMEVDKHTKGPSAYKRNYITETEEGADHGFLSRMFKVVKYKALGDNRLAVYGDVGYTHQQGNYWVATFHYNRKNPGIFINASKNVTLENINLYHALAMGVICQISENITLKNLQTKLREGSRRLLTVCADATHFVNCRGKIVMTDCFFTNMLDDALNIHGIYNKIIRMEGINRVIGGFGHFQQRGIQIYKPGDAIRVIEVETAKTVANYTVKEAGLLSEEEVWVETNEPMSVYDDRYIIENLSANPEVEICNCECGNNRPRGFLLGSPKRMLVENCIFYNMYAGINIGSEMTDWFESGQVNDVTIRGNHFNNSAFAGASPAISIAPKVRHMDSLRHYHKGIVIENNTFTMAERRFLHAHAVDNLIFRNNKFICDENLPKHGTIGADGVFITNCENVVYEPVVLN